MTRVPDGAINGTMGFFWLWRKLGVAVMMMGGPFLMGVRNADPVPIGVSWSLAPLVATPVGVSVVLRDAGPKHDALPPGELFSMIASCPIFRGQLIPRQSLPPNITCSTRTTSVITATITTRPITELIILPRAVVSFFSSPPDETHSNPPRSSMNMAYKPATKKIILMRLPMRSPSVGTQNQRLI